MKDYGKLLGCGRHRVVFAHPDDPTVAIKIAHRHTGPEANRLEWEIWQHAPRLMRRWLAPCLWISEDGLTLHMRRGEPAQRPSRYPAYLMDAKDANWVRINHSVVMCDYSQERVRQQLDSLTNTEENSPKQHRQEN
jgi:hypothetical protein